MYKLVDPQKPIKIAITLLFCIVFLLLLLLVALHYVTKIPFASFTADPAATFRFSPVYGYISNLGIVMWCFCVSVCFFAAATLNIRKDQKRNVNFLISFGVLTSLLMMDDLFMFHESIAPWYLNISEKMILVFYGIYAFGCFYHFRKIVFTKESMLLAISVGALGMSVVIDQISSRYYIPGEYLFEDGFKFIGIAGWLSYFVQYSFNQILAVMMPISLLNKPVVRKIKQGQLSRGINN